ncbi:MAG: hypothetical protein KGK07_07290 [Chloroflexota bacterium]|nr:hypothetical protein [Chloroflexota bacterium]
MSEVIRRASTEARKEQIGRVGPPQVSLNSDGHLVLRWRDGFAHDAGDTLLVLDEVATRVVIDFCQRRIARLVDEDDGHRIPF